MFLKIVSYFGNYQVGNFFTLLYGVIKLSE